MDFTAVKKDQLDPDFKRITDIKGKKKVYIGHCQKYPLVKKGRKSNQHKNYDPSLIYYQYKKNY